MGHLRFSKAGSLFLTAVFLGTLFFCSGCGEKEPIAIGFAGGLSGRGADLGISGRNGAMLAVEQWNAAGGLDGRPARLIVRDDEQDREKALRADRELIDLGVVAIVGHMTSSMTLSAVPLMDESGTVMVSPTATTSYLTGIDDSFLRVSATTREYAVAMARYLREKAGVEIVSIVYDLGNQAYTQSWYEEFRTEYASLGGLVAAVTTFHSGSGVHFYEVAEKALVPAADGLVIVANAMDTAMLCQQVRKMRNDTLVAASEWSSTEKLVELGGSAVEGIIASQFFDRASSSPTYLAFRKAYRARFGAEPGFPSVNAFDAATMILEALGQRRRDETLKEAILRISTFEGLQGPVSLDPFGDARRRTYIATVKDGKFQVLE